MEQKNDFWFFQHLRSHNFLCECPHGPVTVLDCRGDDSLQVGVFSLFQDTLTKTGNDLREKVIFGSKNYKVSFIQIFLQGRRDKCGTDFESPCKVVWAIDFTFF